MEVIHFLLSWTHIVTAVLSLIFGTVVLFGRKGNGRHKKIGKYYFYSMLISNVTALFIYNATGSWFFPHSFAIATLITLVPGFLVTRIKRYRHWQRVHIISFVLSYYMLIGGAINEAFLHIGPLRPYLSNGSAVVGMTHFAAQVFFIGLLIFYLVKYRCAKSPEVA